MQSSKIVLHGLPDDLQVYRKVSVRYRIAHLVGKSQWQLGVRRRKCWMLQSDIAAGLAEIFKVANHRILDHFVR
ncbi:hypothetical protein os1_27980 [Comamonadaceae bacterium OS-1]|nr:hypothetical protein os1_27980 [Comamonadaceae bacterium OS-1]